MGSTSIISPKPGFATATLPPSLAAKLSPAATAKLGLAAGTSPAAAKLAAAASTSPAAAAKLAVAAKARTTAQDFEGVFLNSMFSQMFTGIDGDGPFGGSKSTGVWRSFLTDAYAKNFAQAGGIGLGDHIYRALMAQQEVKSS
jgi:Rod binding domain-containing protein